MLLVELSREPNLPPHHAQPCIFRGLRTALLPHSKQRTQRSTQLLLIAGTLTPNNFGGRGGEHESLTSTRDSTHHWPNRDDKAASSRPVCVCAVELSTRS